jgi:hypothetical protein
MSLSWQKALAADVNDAMNSIAAVQVRPAAASLRRRHFGGAPLWVLTKYVSLAQPNDYSVPFAAGDPTIEIDLTSVMNGALKAKPIVAYGFSWSHGKSYYVAGGTDSKTFLSFGTPYDLTQTYVPDSDLQGTYFDRRYFTPHAGVNIMNHVGGNACQVCTRVASRGDSFTKVGFFVPPTTGSAALVVLVE